MPRAWAIWVLACPLRLRTASVTRSSGVSLGATGRALPGQGRRLAKVRGWWPTVYTNQPIRARNASCPLTPRITRPLTRQRVIDHGAGHRLDGGALLCLGAAALQGG